MSAILLLRHTEQNTTPLHYTRPVRRQSVVVAAIHRRTIPVVPFALQDTQVRSAEGRVAQRVAHRIYGRIDVAQIVEKVPQLRRNTSTARCHRFQEHQDVVRCPCDDERQQNRRQRFRRLLVRLLLLWFLFLLHLCLLRCSTCTHHRTSFARQLFRDYLRV